MEPPIPCLFSIALKFNVYDLEQSPEEHLLERRAGKAHRRAIYPPGKVKIQLEINVTEQHWAELWILIIPGGNSPPAAA